MDIMETYAKERIVSLIDMDSFYVQCEQRLKPETWGKACAVAQYNFWAGGGLIAVNYEARPFGVKRGMRGEDAKKLCDDIHIFTVPDRNGKADLARYREASAEVFDVITEYIHELEKEVGKRNLIILERASIDEAYIDLTKYINAKPLVLPGCDDLDPFNTKLVFESLSLKDWLQQMAECDSIDESHIRLIMGALIVGRMRQRIYERTQFRCSAGISYNKLLAKLVCGANKPNAQTILPFEGVPFYFRTVDIADVRSLGGKFGQRIKEKLGIETMAQLKQIDKPTLERNFGTTVADWLIRLSDGYDFQEVAERRLSNTISCGKNFPGHMALTTISAIGHWIKVLCEEAHERMESDRQLNHRFAQTIVVGYNTSNGQCSKSVKLNIVDGTYTTVDIIASDIMKAVFLNLDLSNPILNLSLSAINFADLKSLMRISKIDSFFHKVDRSANAEKTEAIEAQPENVQMSNDTQTEQYEARVSSPEASEVEEFSTSDEDIEVEEEEETETESDDEMEAVEGESETEEEPGDEEKEGTEKESQDKMEVEIEKVLEKEFHLEGCSPERTERIKRSFFYQKALQLYNFDEIDYDSDLASFPDDSEDGTDDEQPNAKIGDSEDISDVGENGKQAECAGDSTEVNDKKSSPNNGSQAKEDNVEMVQSNADS